MTTLDYFAGQALAGLIAGLRADLERDEDPPARMAVIAYDYAEAMVAEKVRREKPKPKDEY